MTLLDIHEPGQTPLPHAGEGEHAVGIDLGTTHCVVAVARGGAVELLRDAEGHALVPSVVHYAGQVAEVGRGAREKPGAIHSVKRGMGQKNEAVTVSADILRHLKRMAEDALGGPVEKAVITVPAYFDDAARLATKQAAMLAGLTVLRLINEPTAAALAYGLEKNVEGIYAMYDFGGGTFDISILKLEDGVFQVLSTAGDTALGGDDIDHALAEHLRPGAVDVATLAAARAVKEALSAQADAIYHDATKTVNVSRETVEKIAAPFIARTLEACKHAMRDAKCTARDIKGVVLVGGSTRMPCVRRAVAECFEKPPLSDINPDEVVAVGAAIQAAALTQGADHLLLDVTPLSLGLETMGGLMEKIIHRNTPIPVAAQQEFTTWQDGQGGMVMHVVQGEREMVAQNRSLARFELKGIPPMPAGMARVQVNFAIDADGLLTVSAREQTTGAAQVVAVQPTSGISFDQMERMLRDSMEYARADITERLLAEARVDAERAVLELESALRQDGDLLKPGEGAVLASQIERVREAARSDDRDAMDYELQELGKLAQDFAERRMNRAIETALKGQHVDAALSQNKSA